MKSEYGILAQHLKDYVITPVLLVMEKRGCVVYSDAACNLLLLTAAQESLGGRYLHQINGPAMGVYDMEPATVRSHTQWIHTRPEWAQVREALSGGWYDEDVELVGNLFLATFFARVHYYRVPEKLPEATDALGLASYYKQFYNTFKGAATIRDAKQKYLQYTAGIV